MTRPFQNIRTAICDTIESGKSNGIEFDGDLPTWKWTWASCIFLISSCKEISFDWTCNLFPSFGITILWSEKTFIDVSILFWYYLSMIDICCCSCESASSNTCRRYSCSIQQFLLLWGRICDWFHASKMIMNTLLMTTTMSIGELAKEGSRARGCLRKSNNNNSPYITPCPVNDFRVLFIGKKMGEFFFWGTPYSWKVVPKNPYSWFFFHSSMVVVQRKGRCRFFKLSCCVVVFSWVHLD